MAKNKNSLISQKMKEMEINNLSPSDKKDYKIKTIESIFEQLTNRSNRYIFYCPDIAIVNNLVKLIYETCYSVKQLGYEVIVLHEIDGFKCKWLFEQKEYKHLKELKVEYIIKKKSNKSKKTKSNYAFKPSDTLIVPDQFQEILDNLIDVKLVQKVIFVSSYTGLSALPLGVDYSVLGVKKFLFLEKKLKDDYESLFKLDSILIDKYPINEIFYQKRNVKEIYPSICISNIGNNELTQEIINIFYSKYPNLRTFTFKILSRDNFENYIDCLTHCAALLILDKNLGNKQIFYEAINMGIPIFSFNRRECEGELKENSFCGNDSFEIVDNLSIFCQHWLTLSTNFFTKQIETLGDKLGIKEYTYKNYTKQLKFAFEDLQQERIKYFSGIKQSIEKEESVSV